MLHPKSIIEHRSVLWNGLVLEGDCVYRDNAGYEMGLQVPQETMTEDGFLMNKPL